MRVEKRQVVAALYRVGMVGAENLFVKHSRNRYTRSRSRVERRLSRFAATWEEE